MSTARALSPARTPGRPGPGPVPAALLRKVNLVIRRRGYADEMRHRFDYVKGLVRTFLASALCLIALD